MVFCTNCVVQLPDGSVFCSSCGNELPRNKCSTQFNLSYIILYIFIIIVEKKVFCTNCGVQLPDRSAFCSSCGAKVTRKKRKIKHPNK